MITEIKCDILNFLSSLLSLNLFIIGISIKFEIANNTLTLTINKKWIDKLFNSVWEGYKGEHGAMPAKGFCNLCDEKEIRKSVFYMFHLAKKAQKAQAKRDSLKKI